LPAAGKIEQPNSKRKKEVGERPKYTCTEYREEMRLIGLRRRLRDETSLTEAEKKKLQTEIQQLEAEMGLD
jgi:hypothetical protein